MANRRPAGDGMVRQKKRGQWEVKLAEMIAEKKAEIAEMKM